MQEGFFIYVLKLPQAGHAVLPYGYITPSANNKCYLIIWKDIVTNPY
jgi:hypothetical protein